MRFTFLFIFHVVISFFKCTFVYYHHIFVIVFGVCRHSIAIELIAQVDKKKDEKIKNETMKKPKCIINNISMNWKHKYMYRILKKQTKNGKKEESRIKETTVKKRNLFNRRHVRLFSF